LRKKNKLGGWRKVSPTKKKKKKKKKGARRRTRICRVRYTPPRPWDTRRASTQPGRGPGKKKKKKAKNQDKTRESSSFRCVSDELKGENENPILSEGGAGKKKSQKSGKKTPEEPVKGKRRRGGWKNQAPIGL